MKCLKLAGDEYLMNRFVIGLCGSLPGRRICILTSHENKGFSVTFPGVSLAMEVLSSMPPDMVMVVNDDQLIAPVVWCDKQPPREDTKLILASFHGDDTSTDFDAIYERTFDLLPQKTKDECGRCGMGCLGLAEAVLNGEKGPEDCFYAPVGIEICSNGREMSIGRFPSEMIEGSIRGLLSSLKGYMEDTEITVRIGPPTRKKN